MQRNKFATRMAVAAFTVTIPLVTGGATPVHAGSGAGNCLQTGGTGRQPGPPQGTAPFNGFDGWRTNPANGTIPGGVYSYIQTYDPWIAPNGAVGPWTMLALSQQGFYAQIGWAKLANGTAPVLFFSVNEPLHPNVVGYNRSIFPAMGSFQYYNTMFDPTNTTGSNSGTVGVFNLWYNSNAAGSLQYPANFQPDHAENFGETHNWADQMPGGVQTPEPFNDTHLWPQAGVGAGKGWQPFSGVNLNAPAPPANPNAYANKPNQPFQILIWDTACSS